MSAQRTQSRVRSAAVPGGIPWDKEFLKKYRVELRDGMTPITLKRVLDDLLASKVLTDEEEDLILNDGKTRKDKIRNLLDILPSKGQGAIARFKTALAQVDEPSSQLVKNLDAMEAETSLR
ncbi:uncharacterized protein LOC144862070 [Branchiostoma floridae x Branchiostoma japonicum]